MLSQILKVIPSYLTKTQATKEAAYQKKNALKKDGFILKVEIVDAYTFYKKSKGFSQTIKKLGYPSINSFMVHLIYTKIEDLLNVEAHKKEMILKSAPKKVSVTKTKQKLVVSTPIFKSIELFPYKYYNHIPQSFYQPTFHRA